MQGPGPLVAYYIALQDGIGFDRVLARTTDNGAVSELAYNTELYPYLSLVDWDGDTYFSRLQMRRVIPELERLKTEELAPALGEGVDAVLTLARRCAEHGNSFLVFVGD